MWDWPIGLLLRGVQPDRTVSIAPLVRSQAGPTTLPTGLSTQHDCCPWTSCRLISRSCSSPVLSHVRLVWYFISDSFSHCTCSSLHTRLISVIVTNQYRKSVASYYRFAAKSVLPKCVSQVNLTLSLEYSLRLCVSFILYQISVVFGGTAISYRLELM